MFVWPAGWFFFPLPGSLLNTKQFNMISSVGVRAASLKTALAAVVWVIVIRVLIIVSLYTCNCQNIASGFYAERRHRLAKRVRE